LCAEGGAAVSLFAPDIRLDSQARLSPHNQMSIEWTGGKRQQPNEKKYRD
jgi:hypothetical protein